MRNLDILLELLYDYIGRVDGGKSFTVKEKQYQALVKGTRQVYSDYCSRGLTLAYMDKTTTQKRLRFLNGEQGGTKKGSGKLQRG